jgi:hypothetical protein
MLCKHIPIYIFYFLSIPRYHWIDTSAGELLVPEGIIRLVVSDLHAATVCSMFSTSCDKANENVDMKFNVHGAFRKIGKPNVHIKFHIYIFISFVTRCTKHRTNSGCM